VRAALAAVVCLALVQVQQPPAFKSGVSLVTVDVTVVDQDGRPVPDLAAADFEIKLNNRTQPIRGFGYLQTSQDAMAGAVGPSFDVAPIAPAAATAPAVKGTTTVPRVFVVMVDDLSFSPLAGKDLIAAAQRFVSSLPTSDGVGLATTSGTVTVNPTMDRAPVVAGLQKITGAFQDPRVVSSGPSEGKYQSPDQQVGLAQALDIDRGDVTVLKQAIANECYGGDLSTFNRQTLEEVLGSDTCARQVQLSANRTAAQMKATVQRQAQAYEAVIRAMRTASGIRHLLILTDGVALAQDVPAMAPVARAAADAGVQLSVLMTTPDLSLADVGRRPPAVGKQQQSDIGAPQRRREDNAMLLNGARTVTDMAGGAFYQITGAPDVFFERVTLAASGIYRIAVEAPSDTTPGKDFALSVRVPARSGVSVGANRHAVATSPSTATATTTAAPARPAPANVVVTPEQQMQRAIASGRALSGLDVSIDRLVRRGDDPGKLAIDVTLTIKGTPKAPIATMFGLVDASGAIKASSKTLTAPAGDGYRLAFSVPVAPGAYTLRFAAADAAGAVGSIESPVDATLVKMGPLQAGGLNVEALPGRPRTILASIDLYLDPGAPAPDVIVKMAIVGSGADPVVERVIVPDATGGTLRAEAEFALDALPPGDYTLRATVLNGATVLGTATRAIK
jgi:hypothetical protein